MPRPRLVLAAGGALAALLVLASCYTLGTEPEFVRGRLSEQPDSIRRATVIPAELFMEQYKQFREDSPYGRPDYRIPMGVRLSVEILGHGLARSVYVGADGKVDLPLVGPVPAAGRFIDELRADLKKRYAPYFKGDFQVNVNADRPPVLSGDGRWWSMAGRATVVIASSGLTGNVVYLQGDESLTEVLFQPHAGTGNTGLGSKPEWKEIGIIRQVLMDPETDETETVIILCDLEKLLFGGDTRHNVPIHHRDLVFVPRRRDTLLEEVHESLGYWVSPLSNVQRMRDIIKAMEGW